MKIVYPSGCYIPWNNLKDSNRNILVSENKYNGNLLKITRIF